MVGMRVLKIVREGKREETRTRARVPSPFPFRLPSFFFFVNFARALLSERQQHATHM